MTTGAAEYSFHNEWDLESFNVDMLRVAYDEICAEISNNSKPLDDHEMASLFTRAWVKTAGRADDQLTLDVVIDVYCEDLMAYPGDIVRQVLNEWPDQNKWHPLWKPLTDEITRKDDRQKLKSAFRTMLNKLGVPFSELG